MFSAKTRIRTMRVAFLVLLGLILGRVADACLADHALTAGDNAKQLEADQAKLLAALKAALPANDPHLPRLVALQTELTKALTDRIEKLEAEHAAIQLKLQNEKQDLEAKLQEALEGAKLKAQKLEDKILQIDLLAYDRPKAKILTVDREQRMVEVNVGNADFVRPGLTFSVFGDGEYKPSGERKAALEVLEVIGEHKCRARVTEIKNAVRRPIVPGDQLYNPAWTPGLRERVAVIGQIDLNGDGHDNTADFVQALEKEGVIVDAWTDMKDSTVKGARKAISLQTNYLIIGEVPELPEERAARLSAAELEKQLTIRQQIFDLQDQARAKGVTIVNARRFLALVGMPVPRADSEARKKH